jgi:hypothetical protein
MKLQCCFCIVIQSYGHPTTTETFKAKDELSFQNVQVFPFNSLWMLSSPKMAKTFAFQPGKPVHLPILCHQAGIEGGT